MKLPRLEKVTGVTLCVLGLVLIVIIAVLFLPGYSEQLKTVVVTAVLGALGAVTAYWLNSSADQAKKAEEIAKAPTPQVEVPAQTIDVLPGTTRESKA